MPKLAAFPKAFMDPLCKDGSMSLSEWIGLGAALGIDGREEVMTPLDRPMRLIRKGGSPVRELFA